MDQSNFFFPRPHDKMNKPHRKGIYPLKPYIYKALFYSSSGLHQGSFQPYLVEEDHLAISIQMVHEQTSSDAREGIVHSIGNVCITESCIQPLGFFIDHHHVGCQSKTCSSSHSKTSSKLSLVGYKSFASSHVLGFQIHQNLILIYFHNYLELPYHKSPLVLTLVSGSKVHRRHH